MKNTISNIIGFIKKHCQKLGTLLMIAAVVFIIKKIISMDVDYTLLFGRKNAVYMILCILIQTGIIIFMCSPWLKLVEILSGERIPYRKALSVYTKSNFLKYVPGNVFQYIGRNQLAADMGISHGDVACATVIDIVFSMAAPFVIGLVLVGGGAVKILEAYGKSFAAVALAGCVLVTAVIIVLIKFRSRFSKVLEKYRKVFVKENIKRILLTFVYYLVQNAVTVVMCVTALRHIIGMNQDFSDILMFSGVYLFSWIIGFITPGAPGGIGVREAVMMLMCGEFTGSDEIVLFAVVMRVVSVAADALAYGAGAAAGRKVSSVFP